MPVAGRVVELPAAPGEATAAASEGAELLAVEPAEPPEPPDPPEPPPDPPELEASTRTVPFMFGWIVQM